MLSLPPSLPLSLSPSLPPVAFRIYDIDQDGFISNGELFQVLKTMVGNNLTEKQLQEIVDKTILYADKDGDGKISFQEFCDVSHQISYISAFDFQMCLSPHLSLPLSLLGGGKHGCSIEDVCRNPSGTSFTNTCRNSLNLIL